MSRTLFVTRHAGAREWARRRGVEAEFVQHLDLSVLSAGDTVIGTLPVHLVAQLCAKGVVYRHLAMEIPGDERGRNIDADAMEGFCARLEEFVAYRRPPAADIPGEANAQAQHPLSWIERHKGYYGALLGIAFTASFSWCSGAVAKFFAEVYPESPTKGEGFLVGALLRLTQIPSPHFDQTAGARLVDSVIALFLTAFLGWLVFNFGKGVLRPQIISRRADPSRARKAVVMALSELKDAENLDLARQAMNMPLDTVCAKWPIPMNWQQNARALRHHLAPGRKLVVSVVCSRESGAQFHLFRELVGRMAASVGAGAEVRLAIGGEVDFNDYEAVESRFRNTLEALRKEDGLPFSEICVDATSGTKVISIAAAVATMNQDVEFSYVSNAGEVRLFDARLPISGKALPT